MVLGETGTLAGIGVVLGLVAPFALIRLMSSILFNVPTTDPLIFLAVAVGLVLISLAAALLPGRRATRVDPLLALRSE